MKKIINFLFICGFIISIILPVRLNSLDISVNKAAFKYQKSKYLEVYLQVLGNTVAYAPIDSFNKQASVEITVLILKGEEILNYEKILLNSPVSREIKDFITVLRLRVENGDYELVVHGKDMNAQENTYYSSYSINIDYSDKFSISDILLLANIEKNDDESNPFVKNGYYIEPTLFSFLPSSIETLGIYFETYNTQSFKNESMIRLSVNSGFRSEAAKELIVRELKLSPGELAPVLAQIDIKALPSGNYHLKAEIVDEFGYSRFSRSVNFQRSNPIGDTPEILDQLSYENAFVHSISDDSLIYSLKAMLPVVYGPQSSALNSIITGLKYSEGRYFLWRFWSQKNSLDPEREFIVYMDYARLVDKTYRSQVGYGFETDRGFMFLKHGKPNEIITRESEPTAPPYEIWYYDRIELGNQRAVKFIFYMPSLAHNDYILLHSTCIGEKSNPAWFYELYSKRSDSNPRLMQDSEVQQFYNSLRDSFGTNAVKIWEDLK